MRVKSFVVGMAKGIDGAMEHLDKDVAELGDIHIHSVTDKYYSDEQGMFDVCPGPRMVRVVIYEKK